ncbi:MAG: energy transducer TonB, partial [Flavobacteriaceae bacterium]
QPAKLFFTVTAKGSLENIRLDRSSGYPSIDEKMLELLPQVPGKWIPAQNRNGENVAQELVVSFGLLGC